MEGCDYDINQMGTVLNAAINLPFPYEGGEYIQRLATVSFSRH